MGIFSKFRENAVDEKDKGLDHNAEDSSSGTDVSSTPCSEKGLIESAGEILQHSAHNVKEAVFGHMDIASDVNIGSATLALAMEDPFNQSDNVLAAVVEHDVRSSSRSNGHEDDAPGKTVVQTVRDNLAYSAHIVRDTVLGHSHAVETNGNRFAQATSPVENETTPLSDGTDDRSNTIIEAVGEIISHPVQTIKDIIENHNNVVESSPGDSSLSIQDKVIIDDDGDDRQKTVVESVSQILMRSGEAVKEAVLRHTSVDHPDVYDVRSATLKQEPLSTDDLGKSEEHEEDEEVRGLMQTVKDAVHEVKEEVLEVMHEVKEAVMSNDTIPNVPESITEDAGERPSMELVHTIVHD